MKFAIIDISGHEWTKEICPIVSLGGFKNSGVGTAIVYAASGKQHCNLMSTDIFESLEEAVKVWKAQFITWSMQIHARRIENETLILQRCEEYIKAHSKENQEADKVAKTLKKYKDKIELVLTDIEQDLPVAPPTTAPSNDPQTISTMSVPTYHIPIKGIKGLNSLPNEFSTWLNQTSPTQPTEFTEFAVLDTTESAPLPDEG